MLVTQLIDTMYHCHFKWFFSVVSKTLSIVHRGQPTVKQKALLTGHVGVSLWVKAGKIATDIGDIIFIA